MSVPNVLLAIPARGGSKRLKRKNLAPLEGKPMLAYTIQAAIGSGLAERVFVCTEDTEIAEVAAGLGATVFPISEAMSGDEVSSTVPCLALYESLTRSGNVPEFIFNLQPSSPLRTSEDIRAAYRILIASECDFLLSVTPIDPHYFHWAVTRQNDGWELFFGTRFLEERTKLEPVCRPNGAIKIARSCELAKRGHFFGPRLGVYEMPEARAIHVATCFDLSCAEAMLRNQPPSGRKQ